MSQPRKVYPGHQFGTVYSSIIKSAHRIESRNSPTPAQLSEESKAKERMAIKTPHMSLHLHRPTHSPSASLSPEAIFYEPASSSTPQHRRSSLEDSDDEATDHHSRAIRKRDKVKMVSLHLHDAFKSWFKDVSPVNRSIVHSPRQTNINAFFFHRLNPTAHLCYRSHCRRNTLSPIKC